MSESTVSRIIKEKSPPKLSPTVTEQTYDNKSIKADYPNHVLNIDLTIVPTGQGMWASWIPQALAQYLPFCWWIVPIVDHYSRRIMGVGVFSKQPTSKDICALLDKAFKLCKTKPKYII